MVPGVELIFVRHGLPEHVVTRDGSPADPSLSLIGHQQAEAVADWLGGERLDAIYVSTLRRAKQTAAPIESVTGLVAAIRAGIAEFDSSSNRYVPSEELKRIDYEAWKNFMSSAIPLEEDPIEFKRLVVATVGEITAEHPGERVAVVCHGGVINAYFSYVLGRPEREIFFCNVDYTSISRVLVASSGERSVLSLNETSHIRHLPHPRHS